MAIGQRIRRENIRMVGKEEPYGFCTYRSPKTGRSFFFVNDKLGNVLTSPAHDGPASSCATPSMIK